MKRVEFNMFINKHFIKCPHCGYNNEIRRFQNYGTCLRCHKVMDEKIYLKRRYWEARTKYKIKEESYYE